ncbi:MAG: hypothetical protein RL685_776 [Pseudomonadota bacterium]|jgi:uncharacterized linocin/CFP29 family protein
MHNDLVELGWTEEQWNRVTGAVTEEAQRARVATQMLPIVGPEDSSTVAVPGFELAPEANPAPPPAQRLGVNSAPTLFLLTVAVNLQLRSVEVGDPTLKAALGLFRRAANQIARIEDALIFNGHGANMLPPSGIAGIPPVYSVTGGGGPASGVVAMGPQLGGRFYQKLPPNWQGTDVINAVVAAIGSLDNVGQQGPYACALSQNLFDAICTPNANLVMPRDRILPFLQGPLLRASVLPANHGVVVSLGAAPVEVVVASDLSVRYLQSTLEPRYVFRISERVAVRVREENAIAVIGP